MENNKIIVPVVGMGVTVYGYSDAEAYTITRVSPSGKSFWAVQDKATLDPGFKPQITPGGFVGHCTNQNEQTYTYERGAGPEQRFSKTKKTQDGLRWSMADATRSRVYLDIRRKFYDYNF